MHPDWIAHKRGIDAELLGWMQPVDHGFIAIDLLGRARTDIVDWFDAEATLDELGIGYLAEPYELLLESGEWLRVRVTEVSTARIRVKKDDWGDTSAPQIYYTVAFPAPREELRMLRG